MCDVVFSGGRGAALVGEVQRGNWRKEVRLAVTLGRVWLVVWGLGRCRNSSVQLACSLHARRGRLLGIVS